MKRLKEHICPIKALTIAILFLGSGWSTCWPSALRRRWSCMRGFIKVTKLRIDLKKMCLKMFPRKHRDIITLLFSDGMREKDKKGNLLSCLLREVAECKNNVYELKRAMWNDVNEDWPFYTVEDRAALKRRKPQNLTPPGSDTGSTSSGHSPSSTNPASPPQIQCGFKRDRFGDRDEMLTAPPTTKKIRVSTYKRPGENRATKSPLLSSVTHSSPHGMGHLGLDTTDSRLDLTGFSGEPCHDDSAPDWAQFQDGEAASTESVSQSPLRREEPVHPSVEADRSPDQGETNGLVQLATNSNKDFLQ